MANEPKKPEEVDEISADELESVSGGAAYMKLGDIKGESSDKDHKGEIEILSYSFNRPKKG